jgi:TPR repeat protein
MSVLSDNQIAALCEQIVSEFPNQPDIGLHRQEMEYELHRLPHELERTLRSLPANSAGAMLNGVDTRVSAVAAAHLTAAFPWFRDAVQRRAADYYALSLRYERGEGVPQDDAESGRWLLCAAYGGHAQAQFEVGQMFLESGDPAQAEQFLQQAAEQGIANAQYSLACLLHDRHDEGGADRWWRLAAGQNHALAQTSLGRKYQFGWGVQRDYDTAIRWYALAAQQGITDAWVNLGLIYDECGYTQEAINCWLRAANAGHVLAQYNLGNLYCRKLGDYREAAAWWHLAAQQGDAQAQYDLGCLCFNGGDQAQGIHWLRLAAQQRHPGALAALR